MFTNSSARDLITGKRVAIKQVRRVFRRTSDAKKILREMKLMKHFNHDNILGLLDIVEPASYSTFEDVYLVTEKMDMDLGKVIRKGSNYTEAHCKHFLYLLLRGIKALHSANVLHRDLKPANILVDQETCDIKICDFGLARGINPENEMDPDLTQYVTTRWYRAPEVICNSRNYTKAVDMWSVGCIFAELLGKMDGNTRPLFTGKDYADQLNKIIEILGTPTPDGLNSIDDEDAKNYLLTLPRSSKKPFRKLFSTASDEGIDLLEKLLCFDHHNRLSVEEALAHPYLAELHDPEDEPLFPPFDFDFEKMNPDHTQIKELVYEEMLHFHPELGGGLASLSESISLSASQKTSQCPTLPHLPSSARMRGIPDDTSYTKITSCMANLSIHQDKLTKQKTVT